MGHNGSNTCETGNCYLETWEGGKISVKRDHSSRVSESLGAVVVSALSEDPHSFDTYLA